jgi:hypothetical protein
MATDNAFVWCVLEQVRDGELDVETATSILSTHIDQCVYEVLEDNEDEARLWASARELRAKIRRLEAHLHG